MSIRVRILMVVIMVVIAILILAPPPWVIGGGEAPLVNGIPECPRHDTIGVFAKRGEVVVYAATTIALSGRITAIPEFHDCQRLVVDKKFGPLVAIFAAFKLDTIRWTDTLQLHPDPGLGGADIASIARAARPVATLLNYNGGYAPLHIDHGWNCLYLIKTTVGWGAQIDPVSDGNECLQPPREGGARLPVRVAASTDPPPVARWDWDTANGFHYIGIRCGDEWCEVYSPDGKAPFQSSASYVGTEKGRNDEQRLAEGTTPGTGNPDDLIPGGAVGTAVPIGDLAKLEIDDFKAWHAVASVSMSASSAVYQNKYRYVAGSPPSGETTVSLCMGPGSNCFGSWSRRWIKAFTLGTWTVNYCDQQGDPWWAMVVSSGGTKYRCVVRRQHPPEIQDLIPNAVRWRWKIKDEGMWIRCPGSCCEKT